MIRLVLPIKWKTSKHRKANSSKAFMKVICKRKSILLTSVAAFLNGAGFPFFAGTLYFA